MSQFALPLAWPEGPADEEFVITPSNEVAVHLIERWATWPVMTAILTGPRKSGRSLLSRIFVARSDGTVIDNAHDRADRDLFHAWNAAQADRRPLLLVADAAPPSWAPRLPDLASRLAASPVARIAPPDDALMRALLQRQFARRGVDARRDVIDWIVPRIGRTHLDIMRVVDTLDQLMLERRRRLTIPLARSALIAAALIAQRP